MNFEFSAEQTQLKDIARKFLEKEDSVKRARTVLEGETSYDEELWKLFTESSFSRNLRAISLSCVCSAENSKFIFVLAFF